MKNRDMRLKINKGVIITSLILTTVYLYPVKTFAKIEEKNSLIIMLDEGTINKEKIEKFTNEFPNIRPHPIEEIDSLVVDNVKNNQVSEIKNYVEKSFKIPSTNIVKDVKLTAPNLNLESSVIEVKDESELINKDLGSYDKWMWDIKQITNNYQSYNINRGSHSTKVGVIDSGIDFNHPDLKQNIINAGKSFVPGDSSTQDRLGHGTMIAGNIAANGKIKGIGPELGIVPYKVFGQTGADSSWVIKAIIQATKDNMDVINLSLSTFKSLEKKEDKKIIEAYQRAIKYAWNHNTVVVASAGNEGLDISNPKKISEQLGISDDLIIHIPGGQKDVITVSATTKENTLASYSNYGEGVTVAAPGGDYGPDWISSKNLDINSLTLTTYPTNLPQSDLSSRLGFDNGYEFMVGTSLAVPKVVATVALIKDEYSKKYGKEMSNKKVEEVLYENTDKFDSYNKEFFGNGTVNAYKALKNLDE
ncbi:S8 family serine peptidase [Priestia megaterium]|uniref:S8 family serine peptidase n=1 Tax=Priestia megaterium TaxID=1404 RepID=UPI002878098A|nr:S8 family serine peptidase [Priestia megaterium]MBX4163795.1 S8 family serine peptidase [Priestia megaterium]